MYFIRVGWCRVATESDLSKKYRPTSICQTCLSRKHHLCRSDRPYPNFSPIFYYISTFFVSNSLMTKTCCIEVIFHPREKFSISFTTGCVEVKMCIQKLSPKRRKEKEGHFCTRFAPRYFLHFCKLVQTLNKLNGKEMYL